MNDSDGYNLEVARHKEQLRQMQDLGKRGICAFCREHIESEQREPIELETPYWVVKKNDYPYENTSLHLMLIPLRHVRSFAQLDEGSKSDFPKVISLIEKKFGLKSYALGMRSGDMRFNGGSVEHLHAHIVVGDTDRPDHEPVRFKMSSKPKS